MSDLSSCEYCGTSLNADDFSRVEVSGERHYVATCREYVAAVLRATKRDLSVAESHIDELSAQLTKSDELVRELQARWEKAEAKVRDLEAK